MQQLQYPCDRKIPSNILDQTNIDLVENSDSRKGFVKECVKSVIFIGDKKQNFPENNYLCLKLFHGLDSMTQDTLGDNVIYSKDRFGAPIVITLASFIYGP